MQEAEHFTHKKWLNSTNLKGYVIFRPVFITKPIKKENKMFSYMSLKINEGI